MNSVVCIVLRVNYVKNKGISKGPIRIQICIACNFKLLFTY